MNIEQITLFVAVYQAGSFVRAANNLNIDPSKISRSISALESSLNSRLFNRTTRQLRPTYAGKRYFESVAPLLEEFTQLHDRWHARNTEICGRLRISASVSYGQLVIAPLLPTFREQYPDIKLDLLLNDARVDLVPEEIDIAIRHGSVSNNGIVARKLDMATYHLVASPDYIAKQGQPSHPNQLVDHELIGFSHDSFRSIWAFESDGQKAKVAINPSITSSNALTLLECVKRGLGVGLLANWTIESELRSQSLIPVAPKWNYVANRPGSGIWLIYPSNRYIPSRTQVFADFLAQNI